MRVNNGDVPVTSGYNCSEVWGEGWVGVGGTVINSLGARLGGLLPQVKGISI